jgi:hypothetical protein
MTFKEYLKKVIPYILLVVLALVIAKVFHVKPLSYWW